MIDKITVVLCSINMAIAIIRLDLPSLLGWTVAVIAYLRITNMREGK